MGPSLSVIFPYHNESQTLLETLKMISSQTVMPSEVIFVNSSSTDGSSELLDNWIEENQSKFETKFKNIFKQTDTPASSKNAGIDEASGEWVAFMDCGIIFESDWIESNFKYAKEQGNLEFVSGTCLFKGNGTLDSCAIAQTYGYERSRPTVPSTIIKKSVIAIAGKFEIDRRAGYDAVWPLQVIHSGFSRGINEKVKIAYMGTNFAPSFYSLFKKMYHYSIPTVGLKLYKIPYLYILVLIVGIGISLTGLTAFTYLVSSYFLVRGFLIPIIKSRNINLFFNHPFSFIVLPVVGFVMDAGRISGIIRGIFKYHFKI